MILLNPGPVTLSKRVRNALLGPDLCHREAEFSHLQHNIRDALLQVYGLDPKHWAAILLTGSGTAAVEGMVSSLIPRNGRLLVIENGVYGERISNIATAYGIDHLRLSQPWIDELDVRQLERLLDHELLVVGAEKTSLAVPGLLEAERTTVEVGGVARFAVHSGLPGQEMELAVYRGEEVERRRLTGGRGVRVLEVPVGPDDRGGLGVSLTLVRDHQLVHLSETISVPWSDRELELEFVTFRDKMRPGESETWTIRVRGAEDKLLATGTAELLAYMYDRSLDIFAPHRPPQVSWLYPKRGAPEPAQVSLGVGGEIWTRQHGWRRLPSYPGLRGDRLVFLSGYGIGGPGMRGRRGGVAVRGVRDGRARHEHVLGRPDVDRRRGCVPRSERSLNGEEGRHAGRRQGRTRGSPARSPPPPSPPPPRPAGVRAPGSCAGPSRSD